jgi:hypothetical protein
MNKKYFAENPGVYSDYLKTEPRLEALDQEAYNNQYKKNGSGPVYTFPVVFHIIHENGPENISDAQVKDALRILNEDFRKLNADFANTVASFKPIAADVEFQFCLATKDPNGNPTTGIDRIVSSTTNNAGDNARLNPWNTNNYLNIWIVKSVGTSGSSGYTYYPTNTIGKSTDGVMLKHNFCGSIGTVTNPRYQHNITHEVGHYFDLRHIFEGGSTSTCGDDGITDTPKSKMHDYTCPTNDQSCVSGQAQNMNNYMDYSFCYTMFTEGQKTRMRNSLVNFNSRKNQWTTANLVATGCNTTVGLSKMITYSITLDLFPNPVENTSTLRFSLDQKQAVDLTIYNLLGQKTEIILQKELESGEHSLPFESGKLDAGIYFLVLRAKSQMLTEKIIVK